jgi:hypothetical protein
VTIVFDPQKVVAELHDLHAAYLAEVTRIPPVGTANLAHVLMNVRVFVLHENGANRQAEQPLRSERRAQGSNDQSIGRPAEEFHVVEKRVHPRSLEACYESFRWPRSVSALWPSFFRNRSKRIIKNGEKMAAAPSEYVALGEVFRLSRKDCVKIEASAANRM